MEIKIVDKLSGYFVGFGDLNLKQKTQIEKLNLPDGTYKIKGIDGYIGVWTDNDGKIWTEKSKWFKDFIIAYKRGKARKELAIWDCKNSRSIWLVKQKNKKEILQIKYKEFEYWIYED